MLADSRQYSGSPGLASSLAANSFWNMMTAARKNGLWARSLKTRGEDIWYGMLATQMSKYGSSVFKTSPGMICAKTQDQKRQKEEVVIPKPRVNSCDICRSGCSEHCESEKEAMELHNALACWPFMPLNIQ